MSACVSVLGDQAVADDQPVASVRGRRCAARRAGLAPRVYQHRAGQVVMARIDTDYLIVGAGATGLAFADALIAGSDADVVLVDRRHGPGGHWNDAYPFVRLHQPSAFYGVNSRVLGSDSIDSTGPNAGFYQRATAAEICDYYQRVLEDLLASGQVRFFGMSDYLDGGPDGCRLVSRLTGEATRVGVRRRVVDARYLETSIPATHIPSFGTEPGVRLIPVGDLVRLTGRPADIRSSAPARRRWTRASGCSAAECRLR